MKNNITRAGNKSVIQGEAFAISDLKSKIFFNTLKG
jgi:hypothetical protein